MGQPDRCVPVPHALIGDCIFRSLQVSVRQSSHRFYHCQSCKYRLVILERRAHLVSVCDHCLPVSLRIVPDDQCLATSDVFPVVSHRQPVSDLLIFSFFGLEVCEDVHGNTLGRIMQHTITANDFINTVS